jgi:hypothetical protein
MSKIDLRKELLHLYKPSAKDLTVVEVPPLNYLMIDGQGNPNTAPEYQTALQALYKLSYTLKFASKKHLGIDYVVMPLEGLWWAEDMDDFVAMNKDAWQWTMMMLQPEHITAEMVEEARAAAARKQSLSTLAQVRLERFHEGLSVQIMYVGAYADEGPTIARMHAYIAENGYAPSGKHHEIYLSDPRRTAPEKLKTVIRQPVGRLAISD